MPLNLVESPSLKAGDWTKWSDILFPEWAMCSKKAISEKVSISPNRAVWQLF